MYQTNEHIFYDIYWPTGFRDISNDQNWSRNWCFKHYRYNFFTAIIGVYYARIQGIQTLRSGIINLYQNKVPIYELISGASIAFAALLLIIPGFFTDFVGLLLLVPFTRNIILKLVLRKKLQLIMINKKILLMEK